MSNMLDALALMSGQSFAELPWCDMDSLFLACMVYNEPGDNAMTDEGTILWKLGLDAKPDSDDLHAFDRERARLLQLMGRSRRYGGARLCRYVRITDNSIPIQFAAAVLRTDGGPTVISYRGTDNSITGWRENLYLSFESPVPAQAEACRYLAAVAEAVPGPLVLTGHSKGGNLAVYAATHADPAVQARIMGVWSFDGPGLDDDSVASQGYADMLDRMHSFMPQGSVVGLLMTYQEKHMLVRSDALGIQQHDCFTWHTDGLSFVPADRVTIPGQMVDRTLHAFLKQCTPDQRRICIQAVFDLVDATNTSTVSGFKADFVKLLPGMIQSARGLDEQTVDALKTVAGHLMQTGIASAIGIARTESTQRTEDLAQRVDELRADMAQKADVLRGEMAQRADVLR